MDEIEAKLLAPDGGTLERIAVLRTIGEYRLESLPERRLVTLYLDTPDRLLTRSGAAVRVRRGGDGLELTLKLPGSVEGDVHRRPEWSMRLDAMPGFPFALPPGAPRRELEQRGLNRPVEPLVETRIDRRPRRVRQGRREVGELVLDAVEIALPAGRARAPGGAERFFEVEIELLPKGREEDLVLLVNALCSRFPLARSPQSKLERALEWAGLLTG